MEKEKSRKKLFVILLALFCFVSFTGLSVSQSLSEVRDEAGRLVRGILSFKQIKLLNAFRKAHAGEVLERISDNAYDGIKLWRGLKLTESQQDALIKLHSGHIDEAALVLADLNVSGAALREAVVTGNPENPVIRQTAMQHAQNIGNVALFASNILNDARAILTPEQKEVFYRHIARQFDLNRSMLDEMPARVEDAVVLWNNLALTPAQIEALSVVQIHMAEFMRRRQEKQEAEFWKDLAGILTADQFKVANAYRDTEIAAFKARADSDWIEQKIFMHDLALTGQQKKQLVEILLNNREEIETAVRLVAESGMILEGAVLAENGDQAAIEKASLKLGEAIVYSAIVCANLVAQAKTVLTTAQFDMVLKVARDNDKRATQDVLDMPSHLNKFIALWNDVRLTPEQKDAIVQLIEDKIGEQIAETERILRAP